MMNQVIRKSLIVAAASIFLFSISCAKAVAPKCDDEKVKETLIKIVRKAGLDSKSGPFDKDIAYLRNVKYDPNDPMTFVNLKTYCSDDVLQGETYAEKLAACIRDEEARKSKLISYINDLKMGFKDIRTTSTDDKTGKQVCACNLTINDEKGIHILLPLTYTSELSDGGKNFSVTVTSGL